MKHTRYVNLLLSSRSRVTAWPSVNKWLKRGAIFASEFKRFQMISDHDAREDGSSRNVRQLETRIARKLRGHDRASQVIRWLSPMSLFDCVIGRPLCALHARYLRVKRTERSDFSRETLDRGIFKGELWSTTSYDSSGTKLECTVWIETFSKSAVCL